MICNYKIMKEGYDESYRNYEVASQRIWVQENSKGTFAFSEHGKVIPQKTSV